MHIYIYSSQISAIRDEARELIGRIQEHSRKTSNAAEQFIKEIDERIASFEETSMSVLSFSKHSAVPEIVRHVPMRLRQLDEALAMGRKVNDFGYDTASLSDNGMYCFLVLKM